MAIIWLFRWYDICCICIWIETIRLVPEDSALKIEIKGELGGILALCEAGQTR